MVKQVPRARHKNSTKPINRNTINVFPLNTPRETQKAFFFRRVDENKTPIHVCLSAFFWLPQTLDVGPLIRTSHCPEPGTNTALSPTAVTFFMFSIEHFPEYPKGVFSSSRGNRRSFCLGSISHHQLPRAQHKNSTKPNNRKQSHVFPLTLPPPPLRDNSKMITHGRKSRHVFVQRSRRTGVLIGSVEDHLQTLSCLSGG
jgi:hypothetical protein